MPPVSNTTDVKFSVIVPTYNRIALLKKTLESLFQQDFPSFEIIVVNDGGTDGSGALLAQLAEEGKIIYLHHTNRGLAATRKAGLAHARGEFVAFTDDDCVLPKDWLLRCYKKLQDTGVSGVGGSTRTGNPANPYASTNDIIHNYFKSALNNRTGQVPFFTGNNVAYRRSSLEKVGGPDGRFRMGAEDRDLVFRLFKAGNNLVYDPDIVIDHYNDADFFGFFRHQYHLGKGSYLYYTVTGGRAGRPAAIPPAIYAGLLLSPFKTYPLLKAFTISILIILAQCSIAIGFMAEALSSQSMAAKQ